MDGKKDMIGQRFGRLIVIDKTDIRKGGQVWWKCRCDGGNIVDIPGGSLRNGGTKSCGCLRREKGVEHGKAMMTKHGLYGTRVYNIWAKMKQRCNNPNTPMYKHYGGRGIAVCDEWLNDPKAFCEWAFANGYNDDLSIDRIDNNGNYEPSNCQWIPITEQQKNKRNAIYLTYKGKTKRAVEWAKEYGLNLRTIESRIRRGWTNPEEVLFEKRKGAYSI